MLFKIRMAREIVYVSLLGGFGNNLYQIAFAKKIESMGYRVKFDISAKKRAQLEIKEIPELNEYFKTRVANWTRFFPSPSGKNKRWSVIVIKYFLRLKIHIDLASNGKEPEDFPAGYFLTGYWQNLENARYLGSIRYFEQSKLLGTIGIHVRRGDMISNVIYPLDSYFRKSLRLIEEQNPGDDFKVFVFTDDPSYCSQVLQLGRDFTLVQGGTTLDDFLFMISTEYLILSRSTFSWWAGFLSKGEIYTPTPWNLNLRFRDSTNIPTHWVSVSSEPCDY